MENDIIQSIIEKITDLETEFNDCKALILSEDDMKLHICRKIYSLFDHRQLTMDRNIYGSPIHTEIKFFDENEKLTLRPDITILNPQDLSIKHSIKYRITDNGIKYLKTSSKEFEFGGNTIIIELKFCKNKTGITDSKLSTYISDINKIKRIQRIVSSNSNSNNKVFGILVIFNKTDKKIRRFNEFLREYEGENDLKIYYGTSNVNYDE